MVLLSLIESIFEMHLDPFASSEKNKGFNCMISSFFSFRKVRLKRLEELKYDDNGFFEKSNDFHKHGYTYAFAQKVNSKRERKEKHSTENNIDCSKSRTRQEYSVSIGETIPDMRINVKTELPQLSQHCASLDHNGDHHHHKLNGSVRSNGSVPHQPLHSFSPYDNMYENPKYETSKI